VGQKHEHESSPLRHDQVVGGHPTVKAKFGGVEVECLVDTGSMVSMVNEDFFMKHLQHMRECEPLSTVGGWLQITAANGLNIPYVGFTELDVEVEGVVITKRGIVITKTTPAGRSTPGVLGTNVLQHLPAFHNLLGVKSGFVRVAGTKEVLIPANSECCVAVTGPNLSQDGIVEELRTLPGNLHLPPAIVNAKGTSMVVRLFNQGEQDVWLKPRTRLGTLTTASVEDSDVQFTIDEAQIKVSVNEVTATTISSQNRLPTGIDIGELRGGQTLDQAHNLFRKYSSIFANVDDDLGCTNAVKHRITLADPTPVRLPYRRVPPSQLEELRQHLNQLLAKDVIRHSNSEYSSPIVLVRKKSGDLRMCIDYRQLNAKTIKDAYPLPRIDESIDALVGARFFSTMDLQSAFYQVEVEEADKAKTAFTTPLGLYEFNRMPFGLCNGPATYQRLMQRVLHEETFQMLLVYLDDIVVFSRTEVEMLARLEVVFRKLQQVGLKIEVRKCHFFKTKVKFLGHEVSEEGVNTDPEKVRAAREWPRPRTVRELRSFLGFASYYRRFVKGFAQIAGPLHHLVAVCGKGKGQKMGVVTTHWDDICENAFNHLRDSLSTAPILAYADYKKHPLYRNLVLIPQVDQR